jgi:hypothetical protein
MLDSFLVPSNSVVTAKGEGAPFDLGSAQHRVFLLTLTVNKVVEQEALGVTIYGSVDGNTWGAKPVASFPQKFYRGEQPLLLDLTGQPEVRFVRARWEALRWGRGPEEPMFEFGVSLREVSPEVLREAQTEARSRA